MYLCVGSQTSQVVCVEKEAGIVEDKFCNISIKPDDMHKPCNDHQCPARYVLYSALRLKNMAQNMVFIRSNSTN